MGTIAADAIRTIQDNSRGGFTVPTKGLYPYQWNWDSAFTALGIATYDVDRAWIEIESLVAGQWPSGMIPHILFRADEPSYFPGPSVWGASRGPIPSSGISQPPVLASVVFALSRTDPDRARALVPALNKWHDWWARARDPDGLGVVAVTHPWESGRDNLPDWDRPGKRIDVSGVGEYTRRDTSLVDAGMRPGKEDYDRYLALVNFGREMDWDDARIAAGSPFFVADVATTAILLRSERDLLRLSESLGGPAEEIRARIECMERGFGRLWNERAGAYCSHDLRSGELSDEVTSASFLCFYAGIFDRRAEVLGTLERISKSVKRLVPSCDPGSPSFDPVRYWRGPVWAIVNYMISLGLREAGELGWADRIREDTRALIREGGFAEYYSPLDGRACGGRDFSWTAAIWLAWGLGD